MYKMCDVAVFLHHGCDGNGTFCPQTIIREVHVSHISVGLGRVHQYGSTIIAITAAYN